MRVVVITGGLGSGKSTAAEFFRDKGAMRLDLDEIAARLMEPGSELLRSVAEAFGGKVVQSDGRLDRRALAESAFASPEAVSRLDRITHPAIARETRRVLEQLRARFDPPAVVVVEVPLLAESPEFAQLADFVVAVSAPASTRIARAVLAGMTEEDAKRRVILQATDDQRARLADTVLANDGSREEFGRRLEIVWRSHMTTGGAP